MNNMTFTQMVTQQNIQDFKEDYMERQEKTIQAVLV